jgi:hypothetical protein
LKRNLILTLIVSSLLQGCEFGGVIADWRRSSDADASLRLEFDSLDRDVPCRVVYSPDAETRQELWSARHDEEFCAQKALETVSVLAIKGVNCAPAPFIRKTRDREAGPSRVRIWHCEQELPLASRPLDRGPPIPSPKPDWTEVVADGAKNQVLRDTIQEDWRRLRPGSGQRPRISALAHGDLDFDGIKDAAMIVAPEAVKEDRHILLVVYLGYDSSYHFTDAEALRTTGEAGVKTAAIAIENGAIDVTTCCEAPSQRMSFRLENRNLVQSSEIVGQP